MNEWEKNADVEEMMFRSIKQRLHEIEHEIEQDILEKWYALPSSEKER